MDLSGKTKESAGLDAQAASSRCRVALTADFYDEAGALKYADVGLDLLTGEPGIEPGRLDRHFPEITAEQLAQLEAIVVLAPRVTAASLAQADNLLAVARFGVGYDSVDVRACTDHDVALTIAAGAVDRPVAEATLAWMLAMTYRVPLKDRLVREARWDDRDQNMGQDLRNRTLGIIGFGGIGRTLVKLLAGFGMNPPLVFDPHLPADFVAAQGARSVSLEALMREADFISVHCPLTPQTRGIVSRRELEWMKPTAFLINTARGGIVDEAALYDVLRERRIGGAALDCFVGEPLRAAPSFAELDNVILAPHSIAWTEGLFRDMGRAAIQSIIDLRHNRRPRAVVNPEVLERPGFQEKWRRFRAS